MQVCHAPTVLHQGQVALLMRVYGMAAGYSESELDFMELAGLTHDLGKLPLATYLLQTHGKKIEVHDPLMETIRSHSVIADQYLRAMAIECSQWDDVLIDLARAARHHHERWDGAGYPDKLAGIAIPRIARILAVADTIDAMSQPYRSWKQPADLAMITAELIRCAGSQFDPDIAFEFIETLKVKK